ncbi:hypothetical protein EJ05DRAFT_500533 [Pseudovirgaria hyperparasitica]|uniref:Mid2 domain-containing protein n=1 Tax=Pseudovirgaria hyperparasitica TaxID=470096 RepID=A0A6A6W803_9PEZI|nr:uncharacterized protein EJ05DRAFT_500533 [Pseudovirgaria hyperparasitica]KAF2758016.1 hypothetical protein EJ05DRAFT_500533 [Pseudovirgaria hyperparasitica]
MKRQRFSELDARDTNSARLRARNDQKHFRKRLLSRFPAGQSSRLQIARDESEVLDTKIKPRKPAVVVDVQTVDVNKNVVVDADGNTISVDLPTVPAVPQFPTDFVVPSVPQYPTVAVPSMPQVPPYPFNTFVNTAASPTAGTSENNTQSNDVTGAAYSSKLSMSSSTTVVTPTSPSQTSSYISSVSETPSLNSSTTGSYHSSTITTTSSSALFTSASSSYYDTTIAPSLVGAPGGSVTSAPDTGGSTDNTETASTPVLVGGVVGGIAGFVLLLAALLIALRYIKQKRRGGAVQLHEGDGGDTGPLTAMSQRQSFMPPAAAAFFNRFSGASKETDVSTERSFQRVSGRKLPSAFSPGMSMEQARDLQSLSQGSYYRDSQGFYSGSPDTGPGAAVIGLSPEKDKEMMMPGPARTPVVHEPRHPPYGFAPVGGAGAHTSGTSTLSPPLSPHPFPRAGTLGRSHPSLDGSRGSKFTEDV